MEEVFAGKAGLLFFKVDMIFEGRDAMLFLLWKRGGGGIRFAFGMRRSAPKKRIPRAIATRWLHGCVGRLPLLQSGHDFRGRDVVHSLFPKVEMIFGGRDAMLSPPLEKGGRGDSLLPTVRGDLHQKANPPRESDVIAAWLR
jgi:hypothetical protein